MRYSASGTLGEFKTMVKTLHAAGLEVILDVVYNHTAEGDHHRADASLPRHRQPDLLPARSRAPAALSQLHRHRQQPQHRAPRGARPGDGQPALLGAGDARRRLPLRPRRDARAQRAGRVRPQRRLPRRGAPGPGAVAGQADRRAVGPRRRRLPARQLPARLGASGTTSTATRRAPTGAATTTPSATSPRASPARTTSSRAPAARRTPASTSSPRTTASRCTIS